MQRMASVESREDQLKMGIEIARESVERVRDRVAGIQVSAPFGKIATALAVIEGLDRSMGGLTSPCASSDNRRIRLL